MLAVIKSLSMAHLDSLMAALQCRPRSYAGARTDRDLLSPGRDSKQGAGEHYVVDLLDRMPFDPQEIPQRLMKGLYWLERD
jgi:hypothetical protein